MTADHAAEVGNGHGACLATVTTASFLPGTLATLGSFPGFNGGVAVIHGE